MKKVLIVDDEDNIREWMTSVLSGHFQGSIEILTAKNGKKALDILSTVSIDLVFTDLRMPEIGGIELLAYLNSNKMRIPVIFITAYATPMIEKQLYSKGAIRVLSKPTSANTLIYYTKEGLERVEQLGSLTGISLDNFLQFISWERKTCLVEVKNTSEGEGANGFFYFMLGELQDAVYEDLVAEEAAYAMLALPKVKITFRDISQTNVKKRITSELMALLLEGARRRDESNAQRNVGEPRAADIEIEPSGLESVPVSRKEK
jgi:two-component system, chemotaxis family, chemotaxis protein CheY